MYLLVMGFDVVLYGENEGICLVLIFATNLTLCGKEESRITKKVKCNYGILQGSLQVIDFNSLFTFFFFFFFFSMKERPGWWH